MIMRNIEKSLVILFVLVVLLLHVHNTWRTNLLGKWWYSYYTHPICLMGKVVKVYDGDTLEVYMFNKSSNLNQYEKVRIKYVDYIDLHPKLRLEKWKRRSNKSYAYIKGCYYEGTRILRQLISNHYVFLLQERPYERDKYGRLLAYADILFNNNRTKLDIGLWDIEHGYAIPYLRFGKGIRTEEYINLYNWVYANKVGCLWNTSTSY